MASKTATKPRAEKPAAKPAPAAKEAAKAPDAKTPGAGAAAPKPAASSGKTLCLVDGSGYIFRAFHALPPLTRPDGTPVGAVLGFTNMLLKLMASHSCDHLAVIFDAGRKTFRNEIYTDYKANRDEPPPELLPQFGLVREASRAFNVPALEAPGFEADDLIAAYARAAVEGGWKVTIVSSDKDLMQLVRPGVDMLDPIKYRPIGEAEVRERFGVGPEKVVDVQALAGDSTDNVPGVPGIGVKTAAELINTYGDLDTLLARAGEIKQPKRREALLAHRDDALMSRELVRLKDDVELPAKVADLGIKQPDPKTLVAFLAAQGFRSVITRLKTEGLIDAEFDVDTVPKMINGDAPAPEPQPDRPPTPVVAPRACKYEIVRSLEVLESWVARATKAGAVALDVATLPTRPLQADLVGIALAIAPAQACYVPIAHTEPGPAGQAGGELDLGGARPLSGQLTLSIVLDALAPLLADPTVLKIGHDLKFDAEVIRRAGRKLGRDIQIAPIDDVMLLSYVLGGGKHGHDLRELSDIYLGHKMLTLDELTGTGKARIGFAQVPLERACEFAGEDADVTVRLHAALKPMLAGQRLVSVYETIERPLIPVLRDMEEAGIAVDMAELRRLSNEFAVRCQNLETQIHKEAKRPFTIGSPQQLGQVLFDEMGLQLPDGNTPKKTKTGAYATGAEVLEELAAIGHKLPQLVLDWRQISKLKSTYTDALVEEVNPETGRVHTSFAMAVASTGRLSSSDPNLQNIPIRTEEGRKIRKAFVAAPGTTLVSFDYSQIELRLLAHVADIAALKTAFREGTDIHALTASEMFGVPVKGMDPMVRRKAKAINFGIIYGISAFGLARQLGIAQGEAREYIQKYFERYPGIRDYMERTKQLAREKGYVTTIFGRRVHLPEIASKNGAVRSFQERAAINAPIQGGAADIIKRAMVRIPAALAQAKLAAKLLLQVHDELLFEVAPREVDATIAAVKAVMENASKPVVDMSVPLVVDVGQGASWADAH